MRAKLTDIGVRKLTLTQQGQVTHWDEATPSFGVRCSTRSKSFVVMYGEKRRLKTLGRYPQLSIAEARKAARRFLATAEDRPEASGPMPISFGQACERFLRHCQARNKERTVRDYTRLLNRHFRFTESIQEISRSDIMNRISSLGATPSEQRHAFVAIRTMMNWCVETGLLESSPLPRLRYKTTSRERVLSDDELRTSYLRALETPYPYGPIVQLLILTGQRRGEIAGMRRSWIRDGVVTFPAGFTKNKREHRLPLSTRSIELVESLPETADLLFPSRGDPEKPFNGWGKCKSRFDAELPFSDYTLHDFRRTFSSNMARLAVPIHVTEKLLNHVTGTLGGIAGIYNRYSYFEEMNVAMKEHNALVERLANSGH